jgi:hypothetical protein
MKKMKAKGKKKSPCITRSDFPAKKRQQFLFTVLLLARLVHKIFQRQLVDWAPDGGKFNKD